MSTAPELNALQKLAKEYRPSMDREVLHSWAADVVGALSASPSDTGGVKANECPGADDPEERCPKPPHECTCWQVELDYHPKRTRSALASPVAWLDTRNEPAEDWTKRVVATNPEYVTNNGRENFAPLYASPRDAVTAPEGMVLVPKEPTEAMVEAAMREEWDEICSDTGCHPLDIVRQGRKLFFHPSHWTAAIAKRLSAALAPALAEPQGVTGLDERMIAAGMIPLSKLLAGDTPLAKWEAHTGVRDLDTFEQWLLMRHREFLTMKVGYELGDKDESDELYEWVLAHSGAFSEVVANFRAMKERSALASPVAWTAWTWENGARLPLCNRDRVEVRDRDTGQIMTMVVGSLQWNLYCEDKAFVAYRAVAPSQEPAAPESQGGSQP